MSPPRGSLSVWHVMVPVQVFNLGIGLFGHHRMSQSCSASLKFSILKRLWGALWSYPSAPPHAPILAAALPNLDFPCYLAGPLVYQEQIVHQPVCYEAGYIIVPRRAPDWGYNLNEQRLQAQRIVVSSLQLKTRDVHRVVHTTTPNTQ